MHHAALCSYDRVRLHRDTHLDLKHDHEQNPRQPLSSHMHSGNRTADTLAGHASSSAACHAVEELSALHDRDMASLRLVVE
eukprot:14599786-Alexandrium_andersonii.AAC.1